MKNQYSGDIGDYGKLGLLRFLLRNEELSLGVNWYLTPDDGSSDGKYTEYLYKNNHSEEPDVELYFLLKDLVSSQKRSLDFIENSIILRDASYYNKELVFSDIKMRKKERIKLRNKWHSAAVKTFENCNTVFLDPDNGFQVKSRSATSKYGNKYVTFEEALDYYAANKNLIVYQHRPRIKEELLKEKYLKLKKQFGLPDNQFLVLTSCRYSLRDYIFFLQEQHSEKIIHSLKTKFIPMWNNYFKLLI